MWLESQLRVLFTADTYYQLQRPGGCGFMVCIVLADMFLILEYGVMGLKSQSRGSLVTLSLDHASLASDDIARE